MDKKRMAEEWEKYGTKEYYRGGEWDNEPDGAAWTHAGFRCKIWRAMALGHLCGYVGIPLDHPIAKKDMDELQELDCHGGITFAQVGDCYKWEKGLYWIGFDANHGGDLAPGLAKTDDLLAEMHEELKALRGRMRERLVYRNMEYMRNETNRLAEQLAKMKGE